MTPTFSPPTVLILSLLQDALEKSALLSAEDDFSESEATGLQWNNEPNDQEAGNRGATWTNARAHILYFIYIYTYKPTVIYFCSVCGL